MTFMNNNNNNNNSGLTTYGLMADDWEMSKECGPFAFFCPQPAPFSHNCSPVGHNMHARTKRAFNELCDLTAIELQG